MGELLDNSAFTRSAQQAFVASPMLARNNGLTEPGEPGGQWVTRQLQGASHVIYPSGGKLYILGTFPERFAIFDGSKFTFPLVFEDACSSYLSGWPPDELLDETFNTKYARRGWAIRMWEGKLVLVGHFNHVNGFESPAGVICMEQDGLWHDMSDGLPDLDLADQRQVVLLAGDSASLFLHQVTGDKNEIGIIGPREHYELAIGDDQWHENTNLSSDLSLAYNYQICGDYIGPGVFPKRDGNTQYHYAVGRMYYSAGVGRWVSQPLIYIVTGTGDNKPSMFYSDSLYMHIGQILDYVVNSPGGQIISLKSTIVWGSGSTWNKSNPAIGCNMAIAKRGEYYVFASDTQTGRFHRGFGTTDVWDQPVGDQAIWVNELVDWQGCVYAGGYFRRTGSGMDYQFPLCLMCSATYGNNWFPVVGVEWQED